MASGAESFVNRLITLSSSLGVIVESSGDSGTKLYPVNLATGVIGTVSEFAWVVNGDFASGHINMIAACKVDSSHIAVQMYDNSSSKKYLVQYTITEASIEEMNKIELADDWNIQGMSWLADNRITMPTEINGTPAVMIYKINNNGIEIATSYGSPNDDYGMPNIKIGTSGLLSANRLDPSGWSVYLHLKDVEKADMLNQQLIDKGEILEQQILDKAAELEVTISANTTALGLKVDKVAGKGLSTNDYTDTEQTKVANISVTQPVDLDTMESNVATNNAKVTSISAIATRTASFTTNTGNQYNKCNSATAINATLNSGIPLGSTLAFSQANVGEITFVAGSGVTLEPSGKKLVEGSATAICIGTNTYRLDGNLEDV